MDIIEKEERDKKVIEMAQAGEKVENIAKENNISRTTAYRILEANNVKINKKKNEEEKQKERETRDKKVIEMAQVGKNAENIAKQCGISINTVYKILKANNVKINKKKNEERDKKIIEMAQAGKKAENIAKECGALVKTVYRILKANNVRINKDKEIEKNERRDKKVIEMAQAGKKAENIAKECDISVWRVYEILKANNVRIDKEKNEARDKKIIEMAQVGKNAENIAKECDISVCRVYDILKANNVIILKNKVRDKKVIEMAQAGEKVENIAEENGISLSTVYRILRTNNIRIKKEKNVKIEKEKSSMIKQIYDTKARVDAKQLFNFIELNYKTVTMEELKLVVQVFTRQGQVNEAIKLINSLITMEDDICISKEQLKSLVNVLEDHRKKIFVMKSLEQNKTVSQISEQMRISTIEVIRIKREWEQRKAKKLNAPPQEPKSGMAFGGRLNCIKFLY